jgi:hypothetical protein
MARDYRAVNYAAYEGPWAPTPPGARWMAFASVVLGLAGVWNVIQGLLAVGSSKVYVGDESFVFGDLRTWGWIIAILGVVQVIAAFGVGAGNQAARWFGVGAALVNALSQLAFLDAAPFWALMIFVLDLLVVYGLIVHGRPEPEPEAV